LDKGAAVQAALFVARLIITVAVGLVEETGHPIHIAVLIVTITLAVLAVLTVVAAVREYIVVVMPVSIPAPEAMALSA